MVFLRHCMFVLWHASVVVSDVAENPGFHDRYELYLLWCQLANMSIDPAIVADGWIETVYGLV